MVRMRHCEVCRGRRAVRLRLYQRTPSITSAGRCPVPINEASREYPCPECGDSIPISRLAVLTEAQLIDSRDISSVGMQEACRAAAQAFVDKLLDEDLIQFELGPEDALNLTVAVRATIGVVSPRHVASLEERIAERQEAVAREVVEQGARNIRAWGRAYSGDEGNISKGQAVSSLWEALRAVLARRDPKRRLS